MEIIRSYFRGKVMVIKPKIFSDNRSKFCEIYNKEKFKKIGINKNFIQDNYSSSKRIYTFRGIHFQIKPYSQAKLIRVINGKIIDYIVDLRKNSSMFGEHIKIILSDKTSNLIYIPEGFGHGFLTLQNNTTVNYKVSNKYSPKHAKTIIYNDKDLKLDFSKFKIKKFILSKNDEIGFSFDQYNNKVL